MEQLRSCKCQYLSSLRCTKAVVYTAAVFSISVYGASLCERRLGDDEMMAVIFARWRCKQRRLSACVTAACDVNLVTDIAASKQLTPRRMLSAGPTAILLYYKPKAPAVTCNERFWTELMSFRDRFKTDEPLARLHLDYRLPTCDRQRVALSSSSSCLLYTSPSPRD